MAADDRDYVTIAHTLQPQRFCAVLMRYQPASDEYIAVKYSDALKRQIAERVAQAWAATLHLEYRP